MKPYYADDFVTLFNADNRDILPTLGRFDLLLTDPQYGLGRRCTMIEREERYCEIIARRMMQEVLPFEAIVKPDNMQRGLGL